jgi:hypothetical protein
MTPSQQYSAQHYRDNIESYRSANRRAKAQKRTKLEALKRNPCSDCGVTYHPDVMQFHHLDPATKEGSIGRVLHRWGWDRIEAEIAKCVLLCANCHILRHVEQRASSG